MDKVPIIQLKSLKQKLRIIMVTMMFSVISAPNAADHHHFTTEMALQTKK